MSEKYEPQSPAQQTADCKLTLLLNVSIMFVSLMVIYVRTPGSYASFNPQFFLYASETTVVIQDAEHLPSFPALQCESCDYSTVREHRGTKSFEL